MIRSSALTPSQQRQLFVHQYGTLRNEEDPSTLTRRIETLLQLKLEKIEGFVTFSRSRTTLKTISIEQIKVEGSPLDRISRAKSMTESSKASALKQKEEIQALIREFRANEPTLKQHAENLRRLNIETRCWEKLFKAYQINKQRLEELNPFDDYAPPSPVLHPEIDFSSLFKKEIVLAEADLPAYSGITLTVAATIQPSGIVEITFQTPFSQVLLYIQKCWSTLEYATEKTTFSEDHPTTLTGKIFKQRFLHAELVQDRTPYDPFQRVMGKKAIAFAVELFAREELFDTLYITASCPLHSEDLRTAGLGSTNNHFLQNFIINKKNSASFNLLKQPIVSADTSFLKRAKDPITLKSIKRPALISLANEVQVTWEKFLSLNALLPAGKDAVLPHYVFRNLFLLQRH